MRLAARTGNCCSKGQPDGEAWRGPEGRPDAAARDVPGASRGGVPRSVDKRLSALGEGEVSGTGSKDGASPPETGFSCQLWTPLPTFPLAGLLKPRRLRQISLPPYLPRRSLVFRRWRLETRWSQEGTELPEGRQARQVAASSGDAWSTQWGVTGMPLDSYR